MSVPYKKILLPLDGSVVAAQALPHAEAIASSQGATLILFEVVEDPMRFMVTPPTVGLAGAGTTGAVSIGPFLPDKDAHAKAMDEAQAALDELATSLKHRKVDAVVDLDTGDPAARIVDYAAEHHVDLIVMSTHGRTGLGRWAYGSVANKVLQAAACPVLVVRPTKS